MVLASKSPRRRQFLEMLGMEFEVIESGLDERGVREENPVELARKLARMKAEDVANRIRSEGRGAALVIGADTLVSFEGKVIGKARDREEAIKVLRGYSGKVHEQITRVCLVNTRTGKVMVDHDVTRGLVRKMSDREIEDYVDTGEPLEGAGCYTPRAHMMLFREIRGSWTNIVGLPMEKFIPMLGEATRER